MKKLPKAVWVFMIAIAAITLLMAGHVALRWYPLRNIQDRPELYETPATLGLSPFHSPESDPCDIGYARFSLPSEWRPQAWSSVEDSIVHGISEKGRVNFLPPYDQEELLLDFLYFMNYNGKSRSDLGDTLLENSEIKDLFNNIDYKSLVIGANNTVPKPWIEILLMNHDEYNDYSIRMIYKSLSYYGGKTFIYENDRIWCIVSILIASDNIERVHIAIGNQDAGLIVSGNLLPDEKDDEKAVEAMKILLKTFRFTEDHVESRAQVAEWIARAGISPEPGQTAP
ncbi:MAG: hypothetical protein KKA60_13360 [Proteobacteria bacterium]|nr:hypothetical protein [Pseudomonadota bacterium]